MKATTALRWLLLSGFATAAPAATFTWDGGGADNDWTTAANWGTNVVPANDGTAAIHFAGTTRPSPNVDVAWNLGSLAFDTGAGAFTLGGSALTLHGTIVAGTNTGIDYESGAVQTINNDLIVADAQTWRIFGGLLTIAGDVTLNDQLTINAITNMTLSGVLGGTAASGGSFTKTSSGTLTLAGTSFNTFDGTYHVSGGTLALNKSLANGAIRGDLVVDSSGTVRYLADDQILNASTVSISVVDVGTLDLNDHSDSINSVTLGQFGKINTGTGVLTVTSLIARTGSAVGQTSTISGNLNLNAIGNREIQVDDGGDSADDLDISAVLLNGGVRKTGNGTLVFSGTSPNTYTGSTIVEGGALILRKGGVNGAILGNLSIGLGGGVAATVQLGASNQIAQTAGNTVTINLGGVLDLGDFGDAVNDVTLAGGVVQTTATGNFTVVGNLTTTSVSRANSITGRLRLGSGIRLFTIADAGGAAAGSQDLSIAAAVLGLDATSVLEKAGPGILLLDAANTFAGGLTLDAGTLQLGTDTSAGTGPLLLTGGTLTPHGATARTLANDLHLNGTPTLAGAALTFTGSVTLDGNSTLTVNNTTTFSAGVGESVAGLKLTKAGTGVLVLSSAGTFTGGFTITGGTVRLGNNNSVGGGSVTFIIDGGTVEAINFPRILANPIGLGSSAAFVGSQSLTFNGAGTLLANASVAVNVPVTFTGAIGESGGARSFTKTGTSTLILGGASTFSGGLILSAGTLGLGNNAAAGTGPITIGGGTTILADTVAVALANAATFAGDFTIGGVLDFAIGGTVTLTGNRTLTLTNNVASTTISGSILQSGGTFGFTKTGTGTLTLSGATANTYGGTTTVNTGTLVLVKSAVNGAVAGLGLVIGDNSGTDVVRLDASEQIANATPVTVNTGAQLNLNGNSETLNNVTLQGGTILTGAGGTLTVGSAIATLASATTSTITGSLNLAGGSRTFNVADGSVVNDLNVTAAITNGSLVKLGAGQLTLGGATTNTLGNTTVNDGTLVLSKTIVDIAVQGNLTINFGTVRLGANNQILAAPGNQVLVGSGLFDLGGFGETIQDLVLNGGTVTTGAGTLTVAGAISSLSSDVSSTISGSLNLGAATRSFTIANGLAADDLAISAAVFSGGITKDGAGTLVLGSATGNPYGGGTTVQAGTLRVSNTSGSATGLGAVVVNTTGTLMGTGIIAGTVTLNSGSALVPGASAGTLTTGDLFLDAASTSRFELAIAGTIGSGVNDLVVVNGALTLDGTLAVTELAGFGNGTYALFDYSGALTNNGLDLQSAFLLAHPGSAIVIDAVNTRVNLLVVPEPATLALVMMTGLGLLVRRPRARRML